MTTTTADIDRHDLAATVADSVAASEGDYDIDAIVDALWEMGEWDDATFWRVVLDHETHPTVPLAERLESELSATIAGTRADRDAIWRDDVVTVRVRGVSRVNQTLPQPTAQASVDRGYGPRVSLVGDDLTWESLAALVEKLGDRVRTARAETTERARSASARLDAAEQLVTQERAHRDAAIRDASAYGVSAADIATATGLSEVGVRKICPPRKVQK